MAPTTDLDLLDLDLLLVAQSIHPACHVSNN